MKKNLLMLTETGILVAMAVVLDLIFKVIPILEMPQGGSVSLAMLPLVIASFKNKWKNGIIAGFVFGVYNFLLDGQAFHWASFILDYSLAFMFVGVAGFFTKALRGSKLQFLLGIFIVFLLRYLTHSICGVIFFAENAQGGNVWVYSFIIYNLPYCLGSYLLCSVVGIAIYKKIVKITNKDY